MKKNNCSDINLKNLREKLEFCEKIIHFEEAKHQNLENKVRKSNKCGFE